MRKEDVRSPTDAVIYLVDCTLATVEMLALRKNPPRTEYLRQIEIAQVGISWLEEYDVPTKSSKISSRINEICGKQTVSEWADSMRKSMKT
jgi:hypothetical protein